MSTSKKIPYSVLRESVAKIFAVYLPAKDAERVAECLVDADLRGVSSHGITRLPLYVRRLREGLVNRSPKLEVTFAAPGVAHLDGDNGMGYVVATRAMEVGLEIAQKLGVAMVTANHSNHFGMAASYVKQALDAGFGAIVLTNAPPLMPVWGGRTPFLGTSPFAMGVPGGKQPLLLDMATSVVAFGKIRRAARLGQKIPADWALDAKGRSTTEPQAVLDGGVILPMAGAKGSGLALLIEAVTGVMAGAAFGGKIPNPNDNFTDAQNVGHFFLVFNPSAWMPQQEYLARLDELVEGAKSTEKAEGVEEIFMPGEIEDKRAEKNSREGIELPLLEVEMLRAEGEKAGVRLDL